jgi:YT521-B-like domain/RNA recognition motif. (a.k.a. RRM, RBD, or RNP domain)
VSRCSSVSITTSSILRGPPRKPRQSGYALWCGNLPAETKIIALKDHFARDATNEIESVFLISKSNCAFVNYRTEEACVAAQERFHDSRFQGAKLVCRLRRGRAAPPAGTPTGPRHALGSTMLTQPTTQIDQRLTQGSTEEGVEMAQATVRKSEEKFFVLKSLTVEDLDASVRNGSWATQSHNEAALNAAYKVNPLKELGRSAKAYVHQTAHNVYLVFSANKSGEYYGYARMVSGIDEPADATENPRPRYNPSAMTPVDTSITPTPATEHAPKGFIIEDGRGTIFWEAQAIETAESKDSENETHTGESTESDERQQQNDEEEEEGQEQSLGHPFKIEWISTVKLPFHRARGLRNPWNQNREVKIARDGTEMEPSVGRRLINLFHTDEVPAPAPPPPQLQYPTVPYPSGYPPNSPFGWSY